MIKRLLTGIRPTGVPHLGNYLGAFRNWVDLQNEYDSLFMIADYHALDSLNDPKNFLKQIYDTARWLIAVGIKSERSIIFRQSQISEHTELAWIFSAVTPVGELMRMTQYKEKGEGKKQVPSALLIYPLLMAADILLYKPSVVPVGEDQDQHVELARAIARKFNLRFGETFPEPMSLHTKTPRIMSIKNPLKKMSKTGDESIDLIDPPKIIRRKIMAAPTATRVGQKTMPAGVVNLFTLLEEFDAAAAKKFKDRNRRGNLKYVDLKKHLAEKIIEHLSPIQQHFHQISDHRVEEVLRQGAAQATQIAATTLHEVKEKIGLL